MQLEKVRCEPLKCESSHHKPVGLSKKVTLFEGVIHYGGGEILCCCFFTSFCLLSGNNAVLWHLIKKKKFSCLKVIRLHQNFPNSDVFKNLLNLYCTVWIFVCLLLFCLLALANCFKQMVGVRAEHSAVTIPPDNKACRSPVSFGADPGEDCTWFESVSRGGGIPLLFTMRFSLNLMFNELITCWVFFLEGSLFFISPYC